MASELVEHGMMYCLWTERLKSVRNCGLAKIDLHLNYQEFLKEYGYKVLKFLAKRFIEDYSDKKIESTFLCGSHLNKLTYSFPFQLLFD